MLKVSVGALLLIIVYSTLTSGQQLSKDPECDCWKYLKHYEAKGCVPVYNETLQNTISHCKCPRKFDCSQADKLDTDNEDCVYEKHVYKIGSEIPTEDICENCRCERDYLTQAPTIKCTRGECFSKYGSHPMPKECREIYKENRCCPTIECFTDENESASTVPICKYNDREYYDGEKIYSDEDPCVICLCNSNWTGINGRSCWEHKCGLEKYSRKLKQGCIPIYHEKTCCPIEYHCPDENESIRNPTIPYKENKDEMCYFEGLYYSVGRFLDIRHPTYCVICTCKIPPDFTCIHSSCPPHPTGDYDNCSPIYKPYVCCPEYPCDPNKVYNDTITGQDDDCECDWRYLAHYEAKGCVPIYKETTDNVKSNCTCPRRFDCSKADELNGNNKVCVHKKIVYEIGSEIPTADSCQKCFCEKDYSTQVPVINCESGECFTKYGYGPLPKECHEIYEENRCCASVECLPEGNENTSKAPICNYNGRMYYEGERIYSDEDPCIECSCNSNWTGINGPSCWKYDCMIETDLKKLKQGCIPIYHEKSCCPNEYHCPDSSKIRRRPKVTYGGNTDDMCYFEGLYYSIGEILDIRHPTYCVICTCKIPPDFTCIHSSCPPHPTGDYNNCWGVYKPYKCCPEYNCEPEEVITVSEDCDTDINLLCQHENDPENFPETEKDLENVCENFIGRYECMLPYKRKCKDNQNFIKNLDKSVEWSYAEDFLNAFKDLCNEDSHIYAVVVDNLRCYKRFLHIWYLLLTKCLSHMENEIVVADYTKALEKTMIEDTERIDSLKNIYNVTICTDSFLVTSCLFLEMDEMCGSQATHAFHYFFINLFPESGCLRFDLLPAMISSYKVLRGD